MQESAQCAIRQILNRVEGMSKGGSRSSFGLRNIRRFELGGRIDFTVSPRYNTFSYYKIHGKKRSGFAIL
ncbi:hypothetical protein HMPREF1986_02854 [Oribacterium sp. oral taxon 078 str. F0263]|nr:hypothetical protein HMPREF1986_02854 [Oribacterium sp. oral taxon 078 str. F0263]